MKLGIIVERRYLRQEMPMALVRELIGRGCVADLIHPDGGVLDVETRLFHDSQKQVFDLSAYDAVISRNRNPLGLALLYQAESASVITINSHSAIQRVRNKAKMAIALSQAGIPCAHTYLADDASDLSSLSHREFPLILKATYGDNSQGLRLVRDPRELADIFWGNNLTLAQKYMENDGYDLKLYVYGDNVFAMRKPSPFSSSNPTVKAEMVIPNQKQIDIALHCGQLFGLELYGVDALELADGSTSVIEVNDFPNYTAVPDAAARLTSYIFDRVKGSTLPVWGASGPLSI